MVVVKVICDNTYLNKLWAVVRQGLFTLQEINQMEHKLCSYLGWMLNIDPVELKEFKVKVQCDFKGLGPYLAYPCDVSVPRPSKSHKSVHAVDITSSLLFTAHSPKSPSASNATLITNSDPVPPPLALSSLSNVHAGGSAVILESIMLSSTSTDQAVRHVGDGAITTSVSVDLQSTATHTYVPTISSNATSLKKAKPGEVFTCATLCIW